MKKLNRVTLYCLYGKYYAYFNPVLQMWREWDFNTLGWCASGHDIKSGQSVYTLWANHINGFAVVVNNFCEKPIRTPKNKKVSERNALIAKDLPQRVKQIVMALFPNASLNVVNNTYSINLVMPAHAARMPWVGQPLVFKFDIVGDWKIDIKESKLFYIEDGRASLNQYTLGSCVGAIEQVLGYLDFKLSILKSEVEQKIKNRSIIGLGIYDNKYYELSW